MPSDEKRAGSLRIGVYGGGFDPPHLGHLGLAKTALAQLGLDEVRLLPTGRPSHRSSSLTPAHHRLSMLHLAVDGCPGLRVDDRETTRHGLSYTIDSLREMRTQWPNARLFLLIGEDQACAFPTWREPAAILEAVTLCVAERPPEGGGTAVDSPASGNAIGWREILRAAGLQGRFVSLAMTPIALSASAIRSAIGQGQSLGGLVPESVARYIDLHSLYQPFR